MPFVQIIMRWLASAANAIDNLFKLDPYLYLSIVAQPIATLLIRPCTLDCWFPAADGRTGMCGITFSMINTNVCYQQFVPFGYEVSVPYPRLVMSHLKKYR